MSAMLRDTKMVNARVSLRTCAYNFNIFESRKRNRRFPPQLMAFSAGLRGDFAGDPGRARTCDLPLRRRLLYPLSYGAVAANRVSRPAHDINGSKDRAGSI